MDCGTGEAAEIAQPSDVKPCHFPMPSCPSRVSGSVLAILAGVPDPVLTGGAPGQGCGWEPCGFRPSRHQSRFLDPHNVA